MLTFSQVNMYFVLSFRRLFWHMWISCNRLLEAVPTTISSVTARGSRLIAYVLLMPRMKVYYHPFSPAEVLESHDEALSVQFLWCITTESKFRILIARNPTTILRGYESPTLGQHVRSTRQPTTMYGIQRTTWQPLWLSTVCTRWCDILDLVWHLSSRSFVASH